MAKLVSRAYSEALFEVALENDKIDTYCEELKFVVDCFKEYPEFYEVYVTPKIDKDERKETMNTVFSDKVSKEVLNFMKILIDKKRGEAIFDIAKDFAEMVNDHKGIKDGIVESVIPMTEDEIQKLSDKLEKLTGNKVNLTNVVNEDILGGILIRVGDRVIDGTFKNKLNNIRENLSQIIV